MVEIFLMVILKKTQINSKAELEANPIALLVELILNKMIPEVLPCLTIILIPARYSPCKVALMVSGVFAYCFIF